MRTIVDALNKLANTANTEAVKLAANKDKESQDKAQALFNKQAKLTAFLKNLKDTDLAVTNAVEASAHPLNPVLDEVIAMIEEEVADLAALPYPNKEFLKALNNSQAMQMLEVGNHALTGIKRNVELRHQALEAMEKEDKSKHEALMKAYNERTEEDSRVLLQSLRTNHFAFMASLEDANRRWADVLKRVFSVNTPENTTAAPAQITPKSNFRDFFSNIFDALTDLFKNLASSDMGDQKATRGIIMNFMAKIIPTVIGFFVNMLKPLFGKDAAEQNTKAAAFAQSASDFVIKSAQYQPPRPDIPARKPVPQATTQEPSLQVSSPVGLPIATQFQNMQQPQNPLSISQLADSLLAQQKKMQIGK